MIGCDVVKEWVLKSRIWREKVKPLLSSATETPTENVKFACHLSYPKLDNVFFLIFVHKRVFLTVNEKKTQILYFYDVFV